MPMYCTMNTDTPRERGIQPSAEKTGHDSNTTIGVRQMLSTDIYLCTKTFNLARGRQSLSSAGNTSVNQRVASSARFRAPKSRCSLLQSYWSKRAGLHVVRSDLHASEVLPVSSKLPILW